MRQQNNYLRTVGTHFVDFLLQFALLDTKRPTLNHVAGVSDWCIRKGLTDDSHRHTINLTHGVAREYWVAKIKVFHVVGNEIDVAIEVVFQDFHDAITT